MAKRILEYDNFTGITTYFDYIEAEDKTIIERVQDVEPILEMNKAMQNNPEISREGIKNSWWHYAQIPNIIIEKWKSEYGIDVFNKDHSKAVFRKLNDPQYRYLKTTTKMHRG